MIIFTFIFCSVLVWLATQERIVRLTSTNASLTPAITARVLMASTRIHVNAFLVILGEIARRILMNVLVSRTIKVFLEDRFSNSLLGQSI